MFRTRRAIGPGARRGLARCMATVALVTLCAPAAQAEGEPTVDSGPCTFPNKPYAGRPWPLQRVLLDELWAQATGKGVTVAVIDSGVDVTHPQLRTAVSTTGGHNFLGAVGKRKNPTRNGTADPVGHGTKVAGIIAARPHPGTGFTGLAPGATILPLVQNDDDNNGDADTLAKAIKYAVDRRAQVINISQNVTASQQPTPELRRALDLALGRNVVVVASAGNDGADGAPKPGYPASHPGVLAVASSDRNNERAYFSQSGGFVGIAAPGTDIVSTVPRGGHCTDSGTSFSAPYVAAVAALLKEKHGGWSGKQIVTHLQQTAERSGPGPDPLTGWGVIDPVRALTQDEPEPGTRPVPDSGPPKRRAALLTPARQGETPQEHAARLATYTLLGTGAAVAALVAGAVALRDARRRGRRTPGDRPA
ncbi:type VII secretion-associated serine protease mycosin [Streptomyces candidus]|uniref:Type VII secretion-associated serine protease mycosin n=1 Tax=Streptomyces candidus TaxID=67283 RepID=A0A7X0HJ55_9ACTN|nr:type VII secretion-associated serine protease mycosin [Streptomyces candidus]MBB6438438.1 type VII secretion-associated serine protease mycosin [Streptomyces candidus]GHH52407.1 type VII secretion-associated serine protease [Streptomyces candidus]